MTIENCGLEVTGHRDHGVQILLPTGNKMVEVTPEETVIIESTNEEAVLTRQVFAVTSEGAVLITAERTM